MTRTILAVLCTLLALTPVATPAQANTDGHNEFLGVVFREPNRIYVSQINARRPARAERRTSSRSRTRSTARSTAGASGGAVPTSLSRGSGGGSSGIASYYWQPQPVASGGRFNPNAMTAAHKTLPFGTRVRVTNLTNGRSVVVRINDRGPYVRGRVIDLSLRAAGEIGMRGAGLARVNLQILGRG